MSLLACSTHINTDNNFFPYPITDVTYASVFYDGGSIGIHFVLEDGSKWGLWFDNSDDAKENGYISMTQQNYTSESEIQYQRVKVRKGSKEEHDVLTRFYEFKKTHKSADKETISLINSMLRQKKYRPTRS